MNDRITAEQILYILSNTYRAEMMQMLFYSHRPKTKMWQIEAFTMYMVEPYCRWIIANEVNLCHRSQILSDDIVVGIA